MDDEVEQIVEELHDFYKQYARELKEIQERYESNDYIETARIEMLGRTEILEELMEILNEIDDVNILMDWLQSKWREVMVKRRTIHETLFMYGDTDKQTLQREYIKLRGKMKMIEELKETLPERMLKEMLKAR